MKEIYGTQRDIWREVFCNKDPPAKVPPFKPVLKDAAIPYICRNRKYNKEEFQFLKSWNQSLVDDGVASINCTSRWASRALPVKKASYKNFKLETESKSDHKEYINWLMQVYRQTVDYVVENSKCVPMAGQMPYQYIALENPG